jgi:molybdopterin synthase catalytic subunit
MVEKGSEIEVTILFFAYLRDAVGSNSISLKLPAKTTVAFLKDELIKSYPALKERLSHTITSINRQFVDESAIIPPNAEIAFFPPVSGGDEKPTFIQVSASRIDLNEITSRLTSPEIGGICIFLGIVRGLDPRQGGHETQSLEYQAYIPMAQEKMMQIADEIRAKWTDIFGIAIVQQLGVFHPGEISTIIACSSSHRDQGIFQACRFAIDRLKQIVPVWKKETGTNGVTWIEGEYIPGKGD